MKKALIIGLRNTLIYATMTSGLLSFLACSWPCYLTSKIIARGYLAVGHLLPCASQHGRRRSHLQCLDEPSKGLINNALATIGVTGPDWLTNPSLAIFSIALVDI